MNSILKLTTIALGIFLIAVAYDAAALCSGARHPTVADELGSSDMILVAKVTASQDKSSPDDPEGIDKTIYSLSIMKLFKGTATGGFKVTSENTSGRFPMDVGKSYLLFIKSYNGINIVDPCGNSGPLVDRVAEVDALNKASSLQGKH